MLRALRSSRDFRLLAAGEFVSRAGTAASFVAVWAVAVYELEVSAAALSLLMLANTVPRVLGGWFAGRLVDRFDPRRVLLVANVVGCAGSVMQWASRGPLQLGMATVVAGFGFGAFLPAISSMAPRVVEDEHLLPANAILELTWQVGFVIGPLLGALAIQVGGVRAPLLMDASTFLVAIGFLAPVRLRAKPDETGDQEARGGRGLVAGLRYVWSLPTARYVTILNTGTWIGISFFMVLEPIYVARVLDAPAWVLGLLQTAFGAGAVAGSLAASRSQDRHGPTLMACTTVLCGVGMVTYGGTRSLAIAAVGVAVWGVGLGWTMPVGRTALQRAVPVSRHGMANGVQSTLQSVGEVVPVLAAGQLAALVGVRPTLAGAGIWTIALGAWALVSTSGSREGTVIDLEPLARRGATPTP